MRNFFAEVETQTVEMKEVGQSAETQTSRIETADRDTITVLPSTADTEFQTDRPSTLEEEVQTWQIELTDQQTSLIFSLFGDIFVI